MKNVVGLGTLAAACVLAVALACSGDAVSSPSRSDQSTQGANGQDTSASGDTATHSGGNGQVGVLTISPNAAAVTLDNYLALHATATDANGAPIKKPFDWRTSDEHIAIVGDTGLVHGVGVGTAKIYAEVDGLIDSAVVAVVDSEVAPPPPPPPPDSGTVPDSSGATPPPPAPAPDSTPPDSLSR